jgi:sugar phosphate isomerase/epimerase
MQYGICGSPRIAGPAAQAGYDYFEWSAGGLLKPREDEAAFTTALEAVRQAGLPCPVVNVFVPADLKITGPAADLAALEQYVTVACRRARQAGVQVIVFGSGGARRIPEGFERAAAWRQILDFVGMMAPIAAAQSVIIAVEPLNLAECNVLTTVGECARLVREVDHPAIRLLVDAYHLLKDGDSLEDVAANGDLLAHVHVATVPDRLAPGMQTCDLQPFFTALKRGGYHGRVSIEGNLPTDPRDLRRSLSLLKTFNG